MTGRLVFEQVGRIWRSGRMEVVRFAEVKAPGISRAQQARLIFVLLALLEFATILAEIKVR